MVIRQNGFKCCYMVGAVNPISGGLVGFCYTVLDTDVMNTFLRMMAQEIGYRKHVVLVIDNAGWHHSADLKVPANITLLPLPAYSPELNPIESLWGYMKENFLSGRVFETLDHVIEAGCDAFRRLNKEIIQSVCNRDLVAQLLSTN